jgi:uncharacterized protein DUF6677
MSEATTKPGPLSFGVAAGVGALVYAVLRGGAMPAGTTALLLAALTVGMLAYFAFQSTPRQRRAVLLGWLLPGLGHWSIGQTRRGLVLGSLILVTFLVGLILADFRNISPFDRHPIWGLAHLFGGIVAALTALITQGLHIESENPFYNVGCLYSGVAALLNILAMVDAWDLAAGASPSDEAGVEDGDSPAPAATESGELSS